jgi:hypothetical protein
MHGDMRFSEELTRTAAEAFDLAGRLCGSCKNFHMLWPYLRLAGASGGDVTAPPIASALGSLLSRANRRILIAGCADAGLLAMVARSANPATHITVLDRCRTPLEVCRRFAERWSLPIQVLHLDLMQLAHTQSFDVVLLHNTLRFIETGCHSDVLTRVRRSLGPDGRLIMVFRTKARSEGNFSLDKPRLYRTRLLEQLEAGNIPLPEPREAFRRRLEAYAEERQRRTVGDASRAEVEQSLAAAGFAIESITSIDSVLPEPFRQFNAKIDFLAVAARGCAS